MPFCERIAKIRSQSAMNVYMKENSFEKVRSAQRKLLLTSRKAFKLDFESMPYFFPEIDHCTSSLPDGYYEPEWYQTKVLEFFSEKERFLNC